MYRRLGFNEFRVIAERDRCSQSVKNESYTTAGDTAGSAYSSGSRRQLHATRDRSRAKARVTRDTLNWQARLRRRWIHRHQASSKRYRSVADILRYPCSRPRSQVRETSASNSWRPTRMLGRAAGESTAELETAELVVASRVVPTSATVTVLDQHMSYSRYC